MSEQQATPELREAMIDAATHLRKAALWLKGHGENEVIISNAAERATGALAARDAVVERPEGGGLPKASTPEAQRAMERSYQGPPAAAPAYITHCESFMAGLAHRVVERPDEPTREEEDAAARAIARQAEPVRTKDGLDFDWDRLTPTAKGTYRDWGRAALESRPERSDRRLPERPDGSDNGPCDRCGQSDYAGLGDAYWFAENDLWNEIAGDANLLCPRCFTDACRAAGVGVGWRVGRVGEIEKERP